MNWTLFNHYGDSPDKAFESLCNHLFHHYILRNYTDIVKYRAVNGSGGDGGVEAYFQFKNGNIIAVQSKWFRDRFGTSQVNQIRDSIDQALDIRPAITEYIVCIPRNVTSLKNTKDSTGGRKKLTKNSGDQLLDKLEAEIVAKYKHLKITWWLDEALERELTHDDNEGLHRFWFAKEVIGFNYLLDQFKRQKSGWLFERYIPKLHAHGIIQQDISILTYSEAYRQTLVKSANSFIIILERSITGINKNARSEPVDIQMNAMLETVRFELEESVNMIKSITARIKMGELILERQLLPLRDLSNAITELVDFGYENRDRSAIVLLINSFQRITEYGFQSKLDQMVSSMKEIGLLILCGPGTGKTHGVAFAIEQHLQCKSPGLIIQAFGTPCNSWADIIGTGLELQDWNITEQLNALQAHAFRNDRRLIDSTLNPGQEFAQEATKVLIAVDGLEEDSMNWNKWNVRIRESLQLGTKFSRVKFVFTARPYFFKVAELPRKLPLRVHELPKEGDVPIQRLAVEYFKPYNYNIKITSPALIRGIDSLFALRLFCEAYTGRSISESDHIVTAGNQLLAKKIERMDEEFQNSMGSRLGTARSPITSAISVLSNQFLETVEIDHASLVSSLQPELFYLPAREIDLLLDYLSYNGILVKRSTSEDGDGIPIVKTDYFVTYRSIIEIVIANRTIKKIANGELDQIPAILFKRMKTGSQLDRAMNNERIAQIIVNTMFHEHGKLIGENNFLKKGFSSGSIKRMQREALRKAPSGLAAKYKASIDKQFFGTFDSRYTVMVTQILPGSESFENNFGALYLHDILINQPNAFERDKIWHGPDKYNSPKDFTQAHGLPGIIKSYSEDFYLSEYALHNETPLIFAWCLSTLNQEFRNKIRLSLTQWAKKQPLEFVLLLNLIFECGDPQIQEDLASISLGLAGRLKDQEGISALAQWALSHIFSNLLVHRNVIVRHGFRAIVERAYQYNIVAEEQVKLSRPHRQNEIELLPLDWTAANASREGKYPIVHDLAWYVIGKASEGFLQYPDGTGVELKSNDSTEAEHLLDLYEDRYGRRLYASSWRMAAALAYIKQLGFNRKKGNGSTDETHGSKSKVFTYEEKYTWLAVHYIKGYLADYVPNNSGRSEGFIDDYSKIVNVPNPFEDMEEEAELPELFEEWIQEESLFESIDVATLPSIEEEVMKEPNIDFSKWINFTESQFYLSSTDRNLIAIYNYTTHQNATGHVHGDIEISACFIQKGIIQPLIQALTDEDNNLRFIEHLDRLYAEPDTETYSNPSDLVWMNWIKENETGELFTVKRKQRNIQFALTKVTKTTIKGEEHLKIPSQFARNLMGIVEMQGTFLLAKDGTTVAFLHKNDRANHQRQEMVLLAKEVLHTALEKNGLELIWFVEHFKRKEVLVPEIEDLPHFQRCRKYLVYTDNEELKHVKIWDERFSNERDRYSQETINSLVPEVKTYVDIPPNDIKQIESLIKSGGEVNNTTLPRRLEETEVIAYFKYLDTIIATASLKRPLKTYITSVFGQAQVLEQVNSYELELGYIYVKPNYRGRHLAKRLCEYLLKYTDSKSIFATTRYDNMPMRIALHGLGFQRIGEPYNNKAKTSLLNLYVIPKMDDNDSISTHN